METYDYNDSTAAGFGPEASAAPSFPGGNEIPSTPAYEPEDQLPPLLQNDNNIPASPLFSNGDSIPASPSLSNGNTVPASPSLSNGNHTLVTPVLPSAPMNPAAGCINCSGGIVLPNTNTSVLWTWGILSPFFTNSATVAHVRFYNAAAIREPLDIYLNGRLVVSDLDFMNYTNYLHIVAGYYRLSVYRRTNPGIPIIDTGIQFRGGNYYTLTILGTGNSFSAQLITS